MSSYLYPNARIAVLAKAPVAGTVKTRMQPALSEQQSALLQAQLIDHTIATALSSRVAPVQLWCAPDMRHMSFIKHRRMLALKQQQGHDLGQRMRAAFQHNQGHDFTLLVGTDCPSLCADDFCAAAYAAQSSDVCIAPAHDGGYVLIVSRHMPESFENIHWGSEKVLAQSLSALASAQQSVQLLNALPDLDHPEDLLALPAALIAQLGIDELRLAILDNQTRESGG